MRRPVIIAAAAVLLVALGVAAYSLGVIARGAPDLHGTAVEAAPSVADVSLVAAGGEPVNLGDYRGEHLLVFFGYTNCPDVCPLTMARLSTIYRDLGEPDDLQVVMITVDPDRDSPKVVDEYASSFHPAFQGLGGSEAALDAAAERFYIGHHGDGHGVIMHSSQVLLVDPRGRFSRIYNEANQAYLEADLRSLLGRS
ncbi:MAG TPA: SCO family protein [Trueperaceae bacterium]